MLKKHLLFVLLLVMVAATASAGTWKIHNYYVAKKIQNVFDTGDRIYYLNSYRLFQFDKTTCQTISLSRQNVLSDDRIRQIYYDWENKLLFVAYYTSNIDVIDAQGKVTNISGIKDIVVPVHNYSFSTAIDNPGALESYSSKIINDINFANGKAYVAIGYGYVVIDESTLTITKSYDLGMSININSVAVIGNTMLIMSNGYIYYGEPDVDDPIHTYAKKSGSFTDARLYPIDDHQVFVMQSSLYRYDFSGESPTSTKLLDYKATNIQKTPNGFIANFEGQKYCYSINASATTATKLFSVESFATSNPLGDGTMWVNDANGLHINGSSTNYKLNSLTTDVPYWLHYNGTMNKLYVANSAPNAISTSSQTTANVINTYDGVTWANATAYTAAGSGYEFAFSPVDPTMYFRASWNKGLHKVVNDVLQTTYTKNNALIGTYKAHPAFDNYGNLWVVSSFGNNACPVAVLPKDKVAKTTASKSDWIQPSGLLALTTGSMQRSRFLVASKNNYKIYNDGDYPKPAQGTGYFMCWDNGSEDVSVDNYRFSKFSSFIDQTGQKVVWNYLTRMTEDKDGMIWVGHTLGVFLFDPDVVFDEQPRAVRPLVTKSVEGTGLLCEGYAVYDIGVDRYNNKWLATNDGVYFVSPDGSELYAHYTTSNSDVPSNEVYSIECDTINDRVYIATDNGFAEYISVGDASSINFDNVYAFPNPVEPDFTGMVKIVNLMENSYVTITDRNGLVVGQLGPVVGSALWDACGEDGERLPTGVYNIYCAQGGQPVTTGTPHATIMIIK